MVLGDLNMDMQNDEVKGKEANSALTDFCDRFCLSNEITEPTRVTEKSESLIDVILTSNPERYAKCGNLQLGVSDHDLVFAVRKNRIPKPKPRNIVYRSMKRFNEDAYLEDLNKVPWDTAFVHEHTDDVWDHWYNSYGDVIDEHAPLKSRRIRGNQLPWITPSLKREISRRNRLFKIHRKNPSQVSWEVYKKQRNKVTSLKRKSMKSFCTDAAVNTKHHSEFWTKMKPLLPSKGRKQS